MRKRSGVSDKLCPYHLCTSCGFQAAIQISKVPVRFFVLRCSPSWIFHFLDFSAVSKFITATLIPQNYYLYLCSSWMKRFHSDFLVCTIFYIYNSHAFTLTNLASTLWLERGQVKSILCLSVLRSSMERGAIIALSVSEEHGVCLMRVFACEHIFVRTLGYHVFNSILEQVIKPGMLALSRRILGTDNRDCTWSIKSINKCFEGTMERSIPWISWFCGQSETLGLHTSLKCW